MKRRYDRRQGGPASSRFFGLKTLVLHRTAQRHFARQVPPWALTDEKEASQTVRPYCVLIALLDLVTHEMLTHRVFLRALCTDRGLVGYL